MNTHYADQIDQYSIDNHYMFLARLIEHALEQTDIKAAIDELENFCGYEITFSDKAQIIDDQYVYPGDEDLDYIIKVHDEDSNKTGYLFHYDFMAIKFDNELRIFRYD